MRRKIVQVSVIPDPTPSDRGAYRVMAVASDGTLWCAGGSRNRIEPWVQLQGLPASADEDIAALGGEDIEIEYE